MPYYRNDEWNEVLREIRNRHIEQLYEEKTQAIYEWLVEQLRIGKGGFLFGTPTDLPLATKSAHLRTALLTARRGTLAPPALSLMYNNQELTFNRLAPSWQDLTVHTSENAGAARNRLAAAYWNESQNVFVVIFHPQTGDPEWDKFQTDKENLLKTGT